MWSLRINEIQSPCENIVISICSSQQPCVVIVFVVVIFVNTITTTTTTNPTTRHQTSQYDFRTHPYNTQILCIFRNDRLSSFLIDNLHSTPLIQFQMLYHFQYVHTEYVFCFCAVAMAMAMLSIIKLLSIYLVNKIFAMGYISTGNKH